MSMYSRGLHQAIKNTLRSSVFQL